MDEQVKAKLNKKLIDLVNHQVELKTQKREANASFTEQLKEVTEKIECLAESVKKEDRTILHASFDPYELEAMLK